jgi:hypothetical protein
MRSLIVSIVSLFALSALSGVAHSATGGSDFSSSPGFVVLTKGDGGWTEAGRIVCGAGLQERTLDLSARLPDSDGEYKVRIVHPDAWTANVDNLDIIVDGGKLGIVRAYDVDSRRNLFGKLISRDYDVINVQGRTIEIGFERPGRAGASVRLSMVGREKDPEDASGGACGFPSLLHPEADGEDVFSYRLGTHSGSMRVDGVITPDDGLGTPIFKSLTKPISGHPDGYAYGYLKNDDKYLYGAVDFTSDNTFDGTEDFAALIIKTPRGWRRFTVRIDEQHWGKTGFTYTDKVPYQHRIYEFKIPLARLGCSADGSDVLQVKYLANIR